MTRSVSLFYKISTLVLLILLKNNYAGAQTQNNQLVLEINPGPDNPRNSEGGFIGLKDGRILFVYSRFSGSSGSDHAPAQLVGRYSSDGGLTWTREDQVIVDKEGDMNVMSVSLLRLQNDKIALVYARKNSMDDCTPQIRISEDEGKSWGAATSIIQDKKGYFVVNNDRIIQLRSGRILIPTSLHKTSSTVWSNKGVLQCYFSDDQGLTWKYGKAVPTPDQIITQEPGLIELKNGIIMMFIRASSGFQYQSFSSDGGETWSLAGPSKIPSPISPASIKMIPDSGDLLLVWNNNGANGPGYFKGKRTPLTVAISRDEGKTWEKIKNIEEDPDGTFCYTAIHFKGDHVLLGYGVGAGLASSYIRRLSLKWVYN
ncbi:MAG: sialidase family protein [Daejeonella sp.]